MKNPYVKPITKAYHVNVSQMIMTSTRSVEVMPGNYSEGHMTDLARQFDFFEEEETTPKDDDDDFDYEDEEFEE